MKTTENLEKARIICQISSRIMIRRTAQQMRNKRETLLQEIIVEDLHFFPYKIQTHHPLSSRAIEHRLCFTNSLSTELKNRTLL